MNLFQKLTLSPIFVYLTVSIAGVPFDMPQGTWIDVEFEGLAPSLEQLSEEERPEQLRDWILLAVAARTPAIGEAERDVLFDLAPYRYEIYDALHNRAYGASRRLTLPEGQLLVLVPEGQAEQPASIGRQADEARVAQGKIPSAVHIVEYRLNEEETRAAFRWVRTLPGKEVYSPAFGYHSAEVTNRADLESFLDRIDDLVWAAPAPGDGIRLGGRRYPEHRTLGVDLEDLAVLYQADQELITQMRRRLEAADLQEEYKYYILENAKQLLSAEDDLDLSDAQQIVRDQVPYHSFKDQYIEYALNELDLALGFSLDPHIHHKGLAHDLEAALDQKSEILESWLQEDIESESWEDEMESLTAEELAAYQLLIAVVGGVQDAIEEDLPPPALAPFTGEASLETLLGTRLESDEDTELQPSELALNKVLLLAKEGEPASNLDALKDQVKTFLAEQEREFREVRREQLSQALDDHESALQEAISKLSAGREEALFELRRALEGNSSLQRGSQGLAVKELQHFLSDLGMAIDIDGSFGLGTEEAVRTLQEQVDLEVTGTVGEGEWQALAQGTERGQRNLLLADFLEDLRQANSYQQARYDGGLQGTAVGMTLFYTDLMMKLWSFDYEGTAPDLPGFVPETEYPIAPIYWEEAWRFSSTRGWLGPLPAGWDVHNAGNGNQLLFAPIATRLYNASAANLVPGVEVPANASSARFSEWWNRHYTEVADFEPQFHRLNEILKWTVVLSWLKVREEGELFFLGQLPTPKPDLDFESWYQDHSGLRTQIDLPFFGTLECRRLGAPAECLHLIEAEPDTTWGKTGRFVGGVTAAGQREVFQRIQSARGRRLSEAQGERLRPGIDLRSSLDLSAGWVTYKGILYQFQGPREVIIRGREDSDLRYRGPEIEALKPTLKRAVSFQPGRLQLEEQVDGFQTGSLVAIAEGGRVILRPERDVLAAAQAVLKMAVGNPTAFQQMALTIPGVRDVYQTAHGEVWVSFEGDGRLGLRLGAGGGNGAGFRIAGTGEGGGDGKPPKFYGFFDKEPERPEPWRRITVQDRPEGRAVVRKYSVNGPGEEAHSSRLTIRGQTIDGYLEAGELLLPVTESRTMEEALGARELDLLIRNRLTFEPGTSLAMKTDSGEVLWASRDNSPDPEVQKAITDLLAKSPAGGLALRLSESLPEGVRHQGWQLLEMPARPNAEDLDIAHRIVERWHTDRAFREYFFERLESEDPGLLRSFLELPADHRSIQQAFVELEAVPVSRHGLVDLRDFEGASLVLGKSRDAGTRVYRLDTPWQRAALGSIWARSASEDTWSSQKRQTFLDSSREVVDSLERIRDALGTDSIVTREDRAWDLNTLWRLHGRDPGFKIYRDQWDLFRSQANADADPAARLEDARVLITASLGAPTDSELQSIREQFDRLEAVEVPVQDQVTWEQFQSLIRDEISSQLTLIVRGTETGLVFRDREVSYAEFSGFLETLPDVRDMIYLVSNDGLPQRLAADSASFRRVFLSRFQQGVADTLAQAIENAHRFWERIFRGPEGQTLDEVFEETHQLRLQEFEEREIPLERFLRSVPWRKVDFSRPAPSNSPQWS